MYSSCYHNCVPRRLLTFASYRQKRARDISDCVAELADDETHVLIRRQTVHKLLERRIGVRLAIRKIHKIVLVLKSIAKGQRIVVPDEATDLPNSAVF
jgi:hypothetical protein